MQRPCDLARTEQRALHFLSYGPIARRARGWRFGTATISDQVAERLVLSGKVRIDGDVLRLKEAAPIGAGLR